MSMSIIALSFATCISMILCFSNAEPVRNQTYVNERAQVPSAVAGSKGYIVVSGGAKSTSPWVGVAACYAYDIAANDWIPLPSLPYTCHGQGSVTYKNKVYIASGSGLAVYNNVLMLTKSSWIEMPHLNTMAHDQCVMVTVNDSIYVTGCMTNHTEMFSCGSGVLAWQSMADSSKLHYYAGGAELNGYIYVCGAGYAASNFCERYDTRNNSWEATRPMNLARIFHQMVSVNGKLYVFGGANGENEMYDPVNDTWTFFSSVPEQTYLSTAATDGNNIYVFGGSPTMRGVYATQITNEVNVYYPKCDLWLPKKSYPIPVAYSASTFVKSLP